MRHKFKLIQSSQKRISYGGLNFLQLLLKNNGVDKMIDQILPKPAKQAKYSNSEVILNAFYATLMGGQSLEDVNHCRRELMQIKGLEPTSTDTLERRFKQWSEKDTHIFTGEHRRIHHHFNYASHCNQLLKTVGRMALPPKRGGYRLDIDAHILENQKPDAQKAYNHQLGYAPMACFLGSIPVDIECRAGNTSPNTKVGESALRVIKELEQEGVKIKELCSDAAGYKKAFLDQLHRKRIRFYIRVRKSTALLEKIAAIRVWKSFDNKVEYAEIQRNGYRIIVQRELRSDRQISLLTGTAYRYRAIITNDVRQKSDGEFIINYYNKRGGIERNFDELRNDFGWKKMPFKNLKDNAVYLTIMAVFKALFEWCKSQIFRQTEIIDNQAIRLKAFSMQFLAVPAQWIKRSRQNILKIFSAEKNYAPLLFPS